MQGKRELTLLNDSLNTDVSFGSVPWYITLGLVMICFFIGLLADWIVGILLFPCFFFAFRYCFKEDPQFFSIWWHSRKLKQEYDPQ